MTEREHDESGQERILRLPVLPLFETVVFPRMMTPIQVGRQASLLAVDEAVKHRPHRIVLLTQNDAAKQDVGPGDLMDIGVLATLGPMFRLPDGSIQLLAQGEERVRVTSFARTEPFLEVEVERVSQRVRSSRELTALMQSVKDLMIQYVNLRGNLPAEALSTVREVEDPSHLADLIGNVPELEPEQRRELLSLVDVPARLRRVHEIMSEQVEVLELRSRITSEVQKNIDKTQREYLLREQMKEIQRELGELDSEQAEALEWRDKIAAANMPEKARERAEKEVDRLERMPAASPEVGMIRTYLDWLVGMPWAVSTDDQLDIKEAAAQLDRDHFGLELVKERILEHLAVRKLSTDLRSPIICLVGPPGVGKTSLGKSVAAALGRKFTRMSLGGVHDEAEIRGHRRTYIGALPGRIIQALKQAGSNNPVLMLDEIDKVGADFRGDPSSALLEVLDPEQNSEFSDHYLEIPFDLSRVLFITTANVLYTIPPALRDRMEIIELPGYTEEEKVQIGLQFLVPKQRRFHGIAEDQLEITTDAMRLLAREYTREAGVRQLEREIATICRKVARQFAEEGPSAIHVDVEDIPRFLRAARFSYGVVEERDEIGVATGLVVTEEGGDIIPVEVTLMDGKPNFILTGQLGDVMQESARAAMSYVHSRARELGIKSSAFEEHSVHIHVPAGAIPKDGPSAGVTMATALISALSGRKVRRDLAMTGEITLRGRVLPIGGLKQKVLAAHRAGIGTVLFPARNLKDLEEIPGDVRDVMSLVPVDSMDDIVKAALLELPAPGEAVKYAHFDTILLPGLEGSWQTPPPSPAG
ncbi:MAG TPA: endopeptidase La [Chloroflexota bacterium]|nr:endopeptidase La [Chloroflexota bacterium]